MRQLKTLKVYMAHHNSFFSSLLKMNNKKATSSRNRTKTQEMRLQIYMKQTTTHTLKANCSKYYLMAPNLQSTQHQHLY